MTHVEQVMEQRLRSIHQGDPALQVRPQVVHNDWGLIQISQGGEVVGYEFIESYHSWAYHQRFEMYENTIKEGHYVVITVPEDVFIMYMGRIAMMPKPRPFLLCYDRKGEIKVPASS